MRIFEAHEVHPEDDPDWTIPKSGNWEEEQQNRQIRNIMIKQQFQKGKSVQYQSSGWSLWPQVHSMDTCVYEPMCGNPRLNQLPVNVNDVVFCEVQPGDRFYAHKALRIDGTKYIIGNNKGRENVLCYRRHIYGRLIEVVFSEKCWQR